MAVIPFNSGHEAWRDLLERLKYGLGSTILMFLDSRDELRVWMAEYKQKEGASQEAQETDAVGQGDP